MMENNEHLMKFKITKDKLKMEIKLSDLIFLFNNSPGNYDGATVKRGKKKEFAEFIVSRLLDDSNDDSNNTVWGEPFEKIFEEILEGAEDEIIDYQEE